MSNLIFFGSDQYSATAFATILEYRNTGKLENILVVTDQKVGGSEVEKLAKTHGLKVSYYPSNKDEMIKFNSLMVKWFNGVIPIGLCASFDHLIPAGIIDQFGGNLYNLHPSLLPQYRNVSPIQYAIAMGDKETGITLFRISTGIDNGEIIAQTEEPILPDDTTPTLTPRLFKKGADLFIQILQGSELCNTNNDYKVPNLVTATTPLIFTHRLTRDSGYIEWAVLHKLLTGKSISPTESKNELLTLRLNKDLQQMKIVNCKLVLDALLRALTPWPGIWSTVPTKKAKGPELAEGVELRLSLESLSPIMVKLASKPKPISFSDFTKYYL